MSMRALSPLVLLSVTATVVSVLDTDVTERLSWLEYCLALMDPKVSFPQPNRKGGREFCLFGLVCFGID